MSSLQFFVHNDADGVRFKLAGSLSGVDVERVYQLWQREAFTDALRPVILDITFVTEADQHGRALLLIMHRFGARIIAKSPESSAIAQPIVTGLVAPVAKPGWFNKVVRFFWNDRHNTLRPQAEMILRMSSGQHITA
jgi:hypothetical protein